MTTKYYLKQLERLDRTIQNKLSEIYQLKTMASSVTVASDKQFVKSTGDKDRLGKTVARIVDLEKETDRLVDKLLAQRHHIISQIEGIENTDHYHILFGCYVSRKPLEQISKELSCSYRQVTREHGKALQEFEEKYGNEYLNQS